MDDLAAFAGNATKFILSLANQATMQLSGVGALATLPLRIFGKAGRDLNDQFVETAKRAFADTWEVWRKKGEAAISSTSGALSQNNTLTFSEDEAGVIKGSKKAKVAEAQDTYNELNTIKRQWAIESERIGKQEAEDFERGGRELNAIKRQWAVDGVKLKLDEQKELDKIREEELRKEEERLRELERMKKAELQLQYDYVVAVESITDSLATLGKLAVKNSRANAEEQKGILTGIAIAEAAGAAVSGIAAVWKEQPNWILGLVETVAVVAAIAASTATQIAAIQGASFAKGTSFAPGGLSLVGEEGPELVNLPRGSQVFTAGQTRDIMNTTNSNITINFSGTGRETTPNDLRKLSRDLEKVFENGIIDRKKLGL
jgi:hypothetical protein